MEVTGGVRGVSGKVRDAEVFGELETIRDDRHCAVRAMHGHFGSLYEIEVRTAWVLGRVPVIIATLCPQGLEHHRLEAGDSPTTFLIHFWKEGRKNRDRHPETSVSQPN